MDNSFFALSGILDSLLHDFTELKWLYASFYPTEYFSKDVLIYESMTPGRGGFKNKGSYMYYFNGTLKKYKTKKRVYANEKSMKKIWTTDDSTDKRKIPVWQAPELKIPVWYNTIDGAISIRTSGKYPKPYSIRQIKAYVNIITWTLFLPSIWYIISYQIKKRKNKILENLN